MKPPTNYPNFEFQIKTQTELQAQNFMTAIAASEIAIEDWTTVHTPPNTSECFGFWIANYPPKRLARLADLMGIILIYAKKSNVLLVPSDE